MPVKKLKEYLDSQHIKYVAMNCSPAFTAQEVAASAHVPGRKMAKTVIIKGNGEFAMVVLPAHEHINFANLKKATGMQDADLASESEFKNKFSECEPGAMPPFGNLYEMPVFVSENLAICTEIVFNAGTHAEVIQMAFADFEKAVKPTIISF